MAVTQPDAGSECGAGGSGPEGDPVNSAVARRGARARDRFLFPRAEAWALTVVDPDVTACFDTELCYLTQ